MKIRVFKNLFHYRELLKTNIKKEIRGKYKGSFLGILWSFINPLLQVLVYAIVFPLILRNKEPHFVTFLVCGIIPWNYFTAIISQGTRCIVDNGGIVKKVYFPREILPISCVTAGLVNFCIQLPIIIVFLIFSGLGISIHFLYFPLIAITQYFFMLAIILLTSAIQVFVRDLEYIVNFFVSLAFYATPIFYSAKAVADSDFAFVMDINPLAVIITNYRKIFMEHLNPDFKLLLIVLASSIVACCVSLLIFRKLEKGFAEEL